jgi:hypothetical protein
MSNFDIWEKKELIKIVPKRIIVSVNQWFEYSLRLAFNAMRNRCYSCKQRCKKPIISSEYGD